jgi:hypothetical protein
LFRAAKRMSMEALVTQAYVELALVPWDETRSRAVRLATFGNYEVRLREMLSVEGFDRSQLWIELYARHARVSIDSCGCDDIEEATTAFETLVSQSTELIKEQAQATA